MPPPASHLVAIAASTTSSGFTDGLGRRSLAFDRAEGTMLERLAIRPELAAFEAMLRDRVERVQALEDERIARPRTVERDADGALIVVSEFVPGSRLSDLLDAAAERGTAPGVDAALGYLLDVLPALCGLHAGAGFPHGALTPSRTVLTPAGQVVILDPIYGGPLSRLRFGRRTLWTEFGIATAATGGTPRLDVASDLAQVALAAVMLVLGRPLRVEEYPAALPRVMQEVDEITRIRASAEFAESLRTFLNRTLPTTNRRPYATADDALIDLRHLATELGADVCRRALVDFIELIDPPEAQTPDKEDDDILGDIASYRLGEQAAEGEDEEYAEGPDLEAAVDAEIDLEALVEDESPYELNADADQDDDEDTGPAAGMDAATADMELDGRATGAVHATAVRPAAQEPVSVAAPDELVSAAAPPQPVVDAPAPAAHPVLPQEAQTEPDPPATVRSRRAKRTRSARSRKDKLRSAAAPTPLVTQKRVPLVIGKAEIDEDAPGITSGGKPPETAKAAAPVPDERRVPEAPPPAKSPATGNWLVAPGRADAFEQTYPDPPAGLSPPFFSPPSAAPSLAPQPVPVSSAPPALPPQYAPVALPRPAFPVTPSMAAPQPWAPAPMSAPPLVQAPLPAPVPVAPVALKLKEPAKKPRAAHPAPPVTDIYAAPPPAAASQAASAFPWKLAAGGLAALAILIVAGRVYLPAGAPMDEPAAGSSAAAAAAPAAAAVPTKARTEPVPGGASGRLEVETQPAGARVLIDGKPAGESPLALDTVPIGRHTITLISSAGTVKRPVRIEAGRTAKLDVPIFSGWVGIFAPFVVEVAEGGQVIGTTEESRLMLSPGRHELTLTNTELGFRAIQTVEIEPGEVRSVTLDPRGTVNLNASPWAEVWVDGSKAGDTPLAGLQLPLGIREITFRHPQLGERQVSVTVKGNAPAALSVDMTKR